VLDLMLPQRDGWSVIESARADGIGTPIVVVSARGTEHDRVHALDIGADDYLVKPFSMAELVARVNAARAGACARRAERGESIEIEELLIDRARSRRTSTARAASSRRPSSASSTSSRSTAAASSRATSCCRSSGDGASRGATAPSTSSCAGCGRRSTARAAAHVHPDALRRRLQARARSQELSFS
jgi:CheY-like chemotaxis protein